MLFLYRFNWYWQLNFDMTIINVDFTISETNTIKTGTGKGHV
jgi:hypothetical protein